METRRGRRESEKARKRSILPPFWLPAEDSFTLRICGLELKKKRKKKVGGWGTPDLSAVEMKNGQRQNQAGGGVTTNGKKRWKTKCKGKI